MPLVLHSYTGASNCSASNCSGLQVAAVWLRRATLPQLCLVAAVRWSLPTNLEQARNLLRSPPNRDRFLPAASADSGKMPLLSQAQPSLKFEASARLNVSTSLCTCAFHTTSACTCAHAHVSVSATAGLVAVAVCRCGALARASARAMRRGLGRQQAAPARGHGLQSRRRGL